MKKAKWFLFILLVVCVSATSQQVEAGSVLPETFNFSGQLLDNTSTPITSGAVLFNVKIYGPSVTPCLLYEEQHTLDLSATNGHFALAVGSGTRTGADPTLSMTTVFDNKAVAKSCGAGGPYTPAANDNRKLVVTVDDGTNPLEILAAQDINMVPFAKVADTIRGFEFPTSDGTSGQVLTTNGAGVLSWSTAAGGGSGTVTSVATGTGLTGGPITTTGTISVDVGATANKIVQLDGLAQLPAVSGVNLTNLNATNLGSGSVPAARMPAFAGDVTTVAGTLATTLSNDAVTSAKIFDGTIATADVADNAITNTKIANNAITSAKINDGTISPSDIAGCTNPNEVLQWNGAAWVCSSALYGSQAANTVLAAPSGAAGAPTFRTLTGADIPGIDWAKITSGLPTTVAGYGITDAVKNAGGTPSIQSGADASKPAAGTAGRLYIANDSAKIYQDTGATWVEISPSAAGGSGTVTSVTAGTGLNVGAGPGGSITASGTLNIDVGTTASKIVQLDGSAQLPAVSGVNLTNLNATNLGSGSVPAARMPAFTGDVTTTAGNLATTIANDAVTSAKILDGAVGAADLANSSITPAKMNIAGSMATNTGLLVRDGSQFYNMTCASNEALIWTVANGWVCSPVVLTESDPSTARSAPDAGKFLTTNGTTTSWAAVQAPLGYTPLNKAGDTMTGALNMGSFDVNASGNIAMSSDKYLGLSNVTNGGETALTSGWSVGEKGRVWYNSTTNKVRFWDGSAAQDVSVGGGGGGITSLGGQTGTSQSFAIGTSGTAPSWSSVADTHTLNIPMASASSVTAGLISKADYDSFAAKLSSVPGTALGAGKIWVGNGGGAATEVAPSGDVAVSNTGAFTVLRLQSINVSVTAPTDASHVLKYNGTTQWEPGFIGVADIRSTVGPGFVPLLPTTCGADETLTFNSPAGTFDCTTISITSAQVNDATELNTADTIVMRDTNGDFAAGNVALTGLSVTTSTTEAVVTIENQGTSTGNSSMLFIKNHDSTNAEGAYLGLANARGNSSTPAALQQYDKIGGIGFGGYDGTSWGTDPGASIGGFAEDAFSNSSHPTALVFSTTPVSSTAAEERMFITADGNVGIGLSFPGITSRLHVAGGAITAGPVGVSSNDGGEVRFSELAANGTNHVGFRAPDSVSSDVIWQLPATDGGAGEVLSTNGSGELSWQNASSFIGYTPAESGINNDITDLNVIENITNSTANLYLAAGSGFDVNIGNGSAGASTSLYAGAGGEISLYSSTVKFNNTSIIELPATGTTFQQAASGTGPLKMMSSNSQNIILDPGNGGVGIGPNAPSAYFEVNPPAMSGSDMGKSVSIYGGAHNGGGAGSAGGVTINGGYGSGVSGGSVSLSGGSSSSSSGGGVTINAGSSTSGNGGGLSFSSGSSGSGINAGDIYFNSQNGVGSGNGSSLYFDAGSSGTGASGNINFRLFTGAGSTYGAVVVARYGVVSSPAVPELQIGTSVGNGLSAPFLADAIAVSTAGSEKMRITSTGNVGIGTDSPDSKLVVNGAARNLTSVSNAGTLIDFSTSNLQYTSMSCGAFTLHNVKTGGSYTLAIQGTTSNTCSFTAYSDAGSTMLTVKLPPGHGSTMPGTHTLYTFLVMGNFVYVSWVPGY